jgi:hypothetical protein
MEYACGADVNKRWPESLLLSERFTQRWIWHVAELSWLSCDWSTQFPVQWAPEACSPGIERSVLEADRSLPSSAKIKNTWRCTCTPAYVFMVWCLIKHRDSFTDVTHNCRFPVHCVSHGTTRPLQHGCWFVTEPWMTLLPQNWLKVAVNVCTRVKGAEGTRPVDRRVRWARTAQ